MFLVLFCIINNDTTDFLCTYASFSSIVQEIKLLGHRIAFSFLVLNTLSEFMCYFCALGEKTQKIERSR